MSRLSQILAAFAIWKRKLKDGWEEGILPFHWRFSNDRFVKRIGPYYRWNLHHLYQHLIQEDVEES